LGCAKSAQLPLPPWLPDAMEGPTPVSALIHAATMVTAGVYLVGRMHPIYDVAVYAHATVALIGAASALFAATLALVQTDIKRVLAYSTMSQIGYMFLAVGIGAYSAGFFHLLSHAFFKALLFMAAGNVIHALHDEQDMRKYGGLFRLLPRTSWSFLIGSLALVGVIPLWKTPTANLNVTVAMALTTIVYVHYHGIRANGIGGYLKHYLGEPIWMWPLNLPIHIIGEIARPISLSLRLFGNMFGEDTVIAILIMLAAPLWIIPAQFPMILLTIFTSFVQAMVFTMLTCTYIAGFVAHHEHHPPGHEHDIVDEEHGLLMDSPLPAPPA